MGDLVEVYTASNELGAIVIKGLLEGYGIPSILKSNAAFSVHAFTVDGMGKTKVMVWEADLERASSLIDEGGDSV